jgi:hypothetical protein
MKLTAKLGRETLRVLHAAGDRVMGLGEPFVQRRHDRNFAQRTRLQPGQLPMGNRVAILLLYQPEQVPGSIRLTLDHLVQTGFAPVVVANGGVPADAAESLLSRAALLLQRPNYGHDFGGYRDGIRLLHDRGLHPTELLILNDSIWFPLWPETPLLADLMQPEADLSGPMFEQKPGRRHSGHFESYLLRAGPALLANPAFWRFWQDYPVSDNRRKVLRNGEKGFTVAMRTAGARIHPLASRAAFLDRIADQDDAFLARTLRYAAQADPDDLAAAASIGTPDDPGFRDRALRHIGAVAAKASLQDSFPYAAMTLFELPFLKRRMTPATVAARRAFCAAVIAGDLPMPSPVIWEEIRARTPGLPPPP